MQVIFTVRAANWLEATLLDLHFSIWKKSRLISRTDRGCPVIFHLLKWSSQWWLVFALMPYLLKYKINPPNSCLRPEGGAWSRRESLPQLSKWEWFFFCFCFFMPQLIQHIWAALSEKGSLTRLAVTTAHLREGLRLLLKKKNKIEKLIRWKRMSKIPGEMWHCSEIQRDAGSWGRVSGLGCLWCQGRCRGSGSGAAASRSSGTIIFPGKSRKRYYFSSRCFYILRTECVLDPAMTHYLILIKSKYQKPSHVTECLKKWDNLSLEAMPRQERFGLWAE